MSWVLIDEVRRVLQEDNFYKDFLDTPLWGACASVISDTNKLQVIIYANDKGIPPYKTLMWLLNDTNDVRDLLGRYNSQIGRMLSCVFKIIGYQTDGQENIEGEYVCYSAKTATKYKYVH